MGKSARNHDKLRNFGRNGATIYLTPADFAAACADYLDWLHEHPLLEEKIHWDKDGVVCHDNVKKKRAPTYQGLCYHINVPTSRLDSYEKRKDPAWGEVVQMVRDLFYADKFEGAAAGLYNAGLIQRDLGLADKQTVEAAVTATDATEPEQDPDEIANLQHPDDPNPFESGLRYSRRQLDAGIPFTG